MLQSISHLAHALSNLRLDSDSLIRICWPSERCRLLKEDIVFVDRSYFSLTVVASVVTVTQLNLEFVRKQQHINNIIVIPMTMFMVMSS